MPATSGSAVQMVWSVFSAAGQSEGIDSENEAEGEHGDGGVVCECVCARTRVFLPIHTCTKGRKTT